MADRYIKVESWESFLGYLVTVKGTVHFLQCCKVFKTRIPRYMRTATILESLAKEN